LPIQAAEAQQEPPAQPLDENEVSDGSHGEFEEVDVGELIDRMLPDRFPWQVRYKQNNLRQ